MFDYIRVHPSLLPVTPEERNAIENEECDFQTKDLDCYLNEYEITPDGFLILVNEMIGGWNYQEVYRQIKYHGHLRFYTEVYFGTEDNLKVEWYEFQAKFTDGKMVEIIRQGVD